MTVVVDALRDTAAASQDDVARLLATEEAAGRAADVKSYWIFNGFAATSVRSRSTGSPLIPTSRAITLDAEIVLPEPAAGEPRLPTLGAGEGLRPHGLG